MDILYKDINSDIIIEYRYDTGSIEEFGFLLSKNLKDSRTNYISKLIKSNSVEKQLNPVDIFKNRWAKITDLNFIQISELDNRFSTKLDTIIVRFSENYDFNNNSGFHLSVSCSGFKTIINYYLSDVIFLKNIDKLSEVEPIFINGKSFNREFKLEIPSPSFISSQVSGGDPISGSLNDLITEGSGLSKTSPIIIEFSEVLGIDSLGGYDNYFLSNSISVDFPHNSDGDDIKISISESESGDWFEVSMLLSGSSDNFDNFVKEMRLVDMSYIIEYNISVIGGNSPKSALTIIKDSEFTIPVDFRPIIFRDISKSYISVEASIKDIISGDVIKKRAIYGLTPDQIIKYGVDGSGIDIIDTFKPKIYVKNIDRDVILEQIKKDRRIVKINIDKPVLFDLSNIKCLSKNDISSNKNFKSPGELMIKINPFGDVIEFTFSKLDSNGYQYLDLTKSGNLKMIIVGSIDTIDFKIDITRSDLTNGTISFIIPPSSYSKIKNIWNSGDKLFYIVNDFNGTKTTLFWSLFLPSDSDISGLIDNITSTSSSGSDSLGVGDIFLEPSIEGEVIIRRRRI
jgi:hypothetical protein